ncbi:hypothetical protein DXV76_06960 [Rhodobacteraceae bacterium CCMM004]|nr:hypothetical protein DXV76_06960 [Rhodobacteraceae bacterium CCMM004]
MDIAFHIGAHCTDDDRLLKTLLRNRDDLKSHGIAVPGPSMYRSVLREVATKLRGDEASQETQDVVLETILEGDDPDRLILINQSFLCMPQVAVEGGQLYPKAAKAAWLRNLFPDHRAAFFLGLRNPATFVPALFAETGGDTLDFPAFLGGTDPRALRWSEMIARLRQAVPDAPLTVWCNEDTPFLWEKLVRAIAAAPATVPIHGEYDMLRTIMSQEGMSRLRAYLRAHPPRDEEMRQRIVAAFLDKFALDDEVEQEMDLPGWNSDLVEDLTEIYDEDLFAIARMPGVHVLTP